MPGDTIAWVDVDGVEFVLDGTHGLYHTIGKGGRFMPTVGIVSEERTGQPGSAVRLVKHQAAEVSVPLGFSEDTEIAKRSALNAWAYRLDPTRGEGKLRVTRPDASQRELNCLCTGLPIEESLELTTLRLQKTGVVFLGSDPYWYDVSDTTATYTVGSAPATWFPFDGFPQLTSSEVFAAASVDNTGDLEVWPVWEIHGPGSDPVLRHLSTNKLTAFEGVTLVQGENITVDTRPGHKGAIRSDGTNMVDSMVWPPEFWSLRPGTNQIRVEMNGATSASSVVQRLKFAYLGA